MFDLKKSSQRINVKIVWLAQSGLFKLVVVLIYLTGLGAMIILALRFLDIVILAKLELFTLSFWILCVIVFLSWHIYYKGGIKKPVLPFPLEVAREKIKKGEKINLADFLTIQASISILKAEDMSSVNLPLIENQALIKTLLEDERMRFVLARMGIDYNKFISGLEKFYIDSKKLRLGVQNLEELVKKALDVAFFEGHQRIEMGDLFAVTSLADPYFSKILFDLNLKLEDVLNIVYWETAFYREKEEKKFDPDRLKLTGGIGRDWAAGYTPRLSLYAKDLSRMVAREKRPLHLIGRVKEIESLEKILTRATHHNVLLIGEPGVGKRTLVQEFARRLYHGQTYQALAHRRIMELDLDFLLAGAHTPGEIVDRLTGVLEDAVWAGNIILFIDNIDALFGGGESKVGAIDASQVVIPYLEEPNLFFIATSDLANFHQFIETKPGLVEKFERIEIKEATPLQTIRILEDIIPFIEKRTQVLFSYESLKSIVKLSDQYIYNKPLPEKAIDLLDEVAVYAASQGKGVTIMPSHVEKVIRGKTGVPVGEVGEIEKEKLLHLEEFLHQRVIGQDEAIKVISNAMRRARAGVGVGKKPIGSFLFLGPTGVGKTETSKALAEAYFGSEEAMIRFDMSEYQDIKGLYRLIGPPPGTPGAKAGGELTSAVKDHPFSLLLLDEIEKAHPDILNLFLQVLDEGWLTDSLGRKVKFNNTIIICTSNAGAELIRQSIKEKMPPEKLRQRLWDYLLKKGLFRPEFLNRFTAVVTFHPLTQEQVVQITDLMIGRLVKRLVHEKGIFLKVLPEAIVKLARLGFDPELGARPIERVIQRKLENILAKKMLSGELRRGSQLVIKAEDISETD